MDGVPGLSFNIHLTPYQERKGKALLLEASRGICDAMASEALHNFLFSIYEAQPASEDNRDSPWIQYLALRALQDSGSYMTPEVTTGILAKMKYLANVVAMVQADGLVAEGHPGGMVGYVESRFPRNFN